MRMRHTSRTDASMGDDRRQVSFRLDATHRQRIADIINSGALPDIRSISDILQDAVWLWFYEYSREMRNGESAPIRVGGTSDRGVRPDLRDTTGAPAEETAEERQVGEAASSA